jgi:hypothetical protein
MNGPFCTSTCEAGKRQSRSSHPSSLPLVLSYLTSYFSPSPSPSLSHSWAFRGRLGKGATHFWFRLWNEDHSR